MIQSKYKRELRAAFIFTANLVEFGRTTQTNRIYIDYTALSRQSQVRLTLDISLADLRGRKDEKCGLPNSFTFMPFLGNFGKIVC